MNRRWQKDGLGRYDSLPSLPWLLSQLPPIDSNGGLADIADVYSVLSALHAKRRNPQPMACMHQGFYYFLADVPTTVGLAEIGAAVRQEPVIPVSSKHRALTMQLLASLFQLSKDGPPASHILLAIVDDDGSVSLMRCFAKVQPPFEGQGALPDALAGGGVATQADSEDDAG